MARGVRHGVVVCGVGHGVRTVRKCEHSYSPAASARLDTFPTWMVSGTKKAPVRNAQTLFYILRLRANEQISLTSRENLATLWETC